MSFNPPSLDELETRLAAATANIQQLQEDFLIAKNASQENNIAPEGDPRPTKPVNSNAMASASPAEHASSTSTRQQQRNFSGKDSTFARNRTTAIPSSSSKYRKVDDTFVARAQFDESTSSEDASFGHVRFGRTSYSPTYSRDGDVIYPQSLPSQSVDVLNLTKRNVEPAPVKSADGGSRYQTQRSETSKRAQLAIEWAGSQNDLEVSVAYANHVRQLQCSAGIDKVSITEAQLQTYQHYRDKATRGNVLLAERYKKLLEAEQKTIAKKEEAELNKSMVSACQVDKPADSTKAAPRKKRKLSTVQIEMTDVASKKRKTNSEVIVIEA